MLVADTSVWAWVLRARWDRERILEAIGNLLQTRGVIVESHRVVQAALEATRGGGGGFPDHLIAQVGLANGAREIITFDQKFSRAEGVRRLK
jgi:predicted nucleic-acid-binding protein